MGVPVGHHDPCGLSPRPEVERADRPALGPDRLRHGHAAHPQGQAGLPQHPSDPRDELRGCGGCSANRSPSRPSCSPRSAGRPSPRRASREWSSVRAWRQGSASRPIRTCYGTPAGSRWQPKGTTPAPFRLISATGTSSTRSATRSYPRPASRTFGEPSNRRKPPCRNCGWPVTTAKLRRTPWYASEVRIQNRDDNDD
jgi:hypothetical protein